MLNRLGPSSKLFSSTQSFSETQVVTVLKVTVGRIEAMPRRTRVMISQRMGLV